MDSICGERALSNDYADLMSDFVLLPHQIPEYFRDDFCYISVTDVFQIVYVPRRVLEENIGPIYEYWSTPKVYGLMQEPFDLVSLEASGILQTQRPPLSLTGRGVVMAFIDTGIDYTNPVFLDSEGNTRILSIWDQTIQTGTPPGGFGYGSVYNRDDINRALQSEDPYEIVPSRDEIGHGSNMAGVAAGSSIGGGFTYLGAAPDAELVVVKLKQCKPYLREFFILPEDVPAYMESDIMLGIKFALSFLVAFQRPVVICLGIGTNMGDHTGSSILSRYISGLSLQRNIGIVVCGGNEGNKDHHFMGMLRQQATASESNYQDVEIRVGEGETGFWLELWGSAPDVFNIFIRSPGGEIVPRVRLSRGQSYTYRFIYERTRTTLISLMVEEISGEQLIMVRFEAPTEGIWTIRVFAEGPIHNGIFHMWLPITQFLNSNTYFLESTPYITLTEPSLSEHVITVSTYNDANNSFHIESGRGFARGGRIKPDIAAPGVNVSTIQGLRTGSSLAAAITSGAVAQFMQWAVVEGNLPLITGNEIKHYLIRGADRAANVTYPNREWGYGRLNISEAFDIIAGV